MYIHQSFWLKAPRVLLPPHSDITQAFDIMRLMLRDSFCVMALLALGAQSAEHVVMTGGSAEWTPGSVTPMAALVGDTLVFNYGTGHDVYRVAFGRWVRFRMGFCILGCRGEFEWRNPS